MKDLKHHIFGKKTDNGTKRFWMTVRTAVDREKGEFIDASLPVNLSKKAAEKFAQYSRETKAPGTRMIRAVFTDAWLKAVPFKDGPAVVMFVNDFEIVVDKANATDW